MLAKLKRGCSAGLIRLAVRVPRAAAEIVLAELLELSPGGLEETRRQRGRGRVRALRRGGRAAGPAGARRRRRATRWSTFDLRGPRRLGGPLEGVAPAGRRRLALPAAARAAAVGGGAGGRDGIDLVIDPGQAFGTGAHHTTRLCLELLLELDPGGALADWGSGSGVLAIAAARLGYAPVLAVDVEPASLEASARERGAQRRPRSRSAGQPAARAGAVGADRDRQPRPPAAARRGARCSSAAPERLITSGLLREEADEVAAASAPTASGARPAVRRRVGAVLLDAARALQSPARRRRRPVPAFASTTDRALKQNFRRRGGTAGSTRTTWPSLPSQIRSSGKRIVKV